MNQTIYHVSFFIINQKNNVMKFRRMFYCAVTFCLFALSSCGPENVDYANKVVGNYIVKITPNINLKYEGNNLPPVSETIETTGTITKDGEDGDVTIKIDGVNGFINDIEMKAYCSGLGMNIEDSSYDESISIGEYGRIECDLIMKNPTTTISNAKIFNWDSTISGECELNYVGLDIKTEASGSINFNLTYNHE